jgi:hypothetical protein
MSPAATMTVQVFAVALFAFILGRSPAHFSGTGLDWALLILTAIALLFAVISLTLGFWRPDA